MTYLTDWSLSTPTESQSQSRTSHTSHFPTTVTYTSTSMLLAPSSTPTPQQHKTNFCYAYQNGSCQRGDSCKYRHESPSHMTSASPSPSHTRGASVPILQHHSTDHNGYSHFPNTTSTNTNTNTNTNTSISTSFEQRNNGYNMHQDRKLVVPQQQRDTYSDPVPRTTTPPVHVQQHNNGGVMLNVPHGACRQWYMRGRCDYGTNCKYQHIHNTGNNHTNNNNNNNNNNGHQQQHQHQQQQHQQHHTSHHHTNSYTNGEMNGLLDSTQSKPLYNRASSLDLNGNSYHHNNNNNQYHTQHNNNNGNGNGLLQTNGGQQQQQHNVCHYYARTGKCKYGGSCKFSHDSHHQQHQQHQHQPQQHNMHNNNNNNTNNNSPIFSTHPAPQQHNNHTFGLNGHNTMNGYAQPFQPQQTSHSHQHSHSMSALNGHGHQQQHHQQHQHHHPSSSHDFLSMPSINKFPSVDMPDTTITTGHTNPLSTLSLNPNPDVFPSAPSSFLRLHSNVPMMDANERDMNDEYIPLQTPAQSSLSSVFGGFTSQQNNNNNAFASPFPSSLSLSLKPSVPLFGSSSTSSSSLLSTPSSALSLSSSSSAASSIASSPVHSHYRADLRCDKCSNLGTVYNKTVPSTNQPISGWYTPSTTMISLCWRCCSCLHCGNAKPISSLGLCAVCNPLQA